MMNEHGQSRVGLGSRSRAAAGALVLLIGAIVLTAGVRTTARRSGAVDSGGRQRLSAHASTLPVVTVYKDPACGCCRAWVERMQAAGFQVQIHDVASAATRDEIKRQQGVTSALAACHTAVVGGYVVEGHVPPELVQRMLVEHPRIAGLAVPGMPAGSPGMEGMGSEHYDVLAFTADGRSSVYAKK